MSISQNFIAEIEEEAKATKRLFERVPEDKLSWRPHAKSRTLGQLALHIARVPGGVTSMCVEDLTEAPSFDPNEPEPKNRQDLLRTFEQSVVSAKELLQKMDDQKMSRQLTFQKGGKTIMSVPRAAFLRSVLLNHNYHHRGQLTVYLRMLNVPLPSVYGPSADENPFAG